jgi:hypothetical protein
MLCLECKNSIQFNSIYLCAKLNSPEANYKVSTGKKMGRVRSKNVNNFKIFAQNFCLSAYSLVSGIP